MNKTYHACGQLYEGTPGSQPGRGETCVKCGADLHCYRMLFIYHSVQLNHATRLVASSQVLFELVRV
jgi:hypothetical protein